MFIDKLVEYYDNVLLPQGYIPPEGYAYREITALVHLNEDGTVAAVTDCRADEMLKMKNGKEKLVKKPLRLLYPEQPDANNSFSYLIEHRPDNLFGFSYDAKKDVFIPLKSNKKRRIFTDKNLAFFEAVEKPGPLVKAFIAFMKHFDPSGYIGQENQEKTHELFKELKDISKEKFAFCLKGNPDKLLQDEPEVKAQWEKEYFGAGDGDDEKVVAYCPVLNKEAPIARLHRKIMKVRGGQASGVLLCSYNNESENSYCKEQSYNSNLSEEAVKKYGTALNYLLSHSEHNTVIDGKLIFVYWAEEPDREAEQLAEAMLFDIRNDMSAAAESLLIESTNAVKQGRRPEFSNEYKDKKFCIAGLSPNSARLCVRFFCENTFGEIAENIAKHQAAITFDEPLSSEKYKPVRLYEITEAIKKPSQDSNEANITYSLINAILRGQPYPAKLMSKALDRIAHDKKANRFTERCRIGIIRAAFNSCHKNKDKEVLGLSLDTTNKNPGYLCGRLFAVYEMVQKNASSVPLNRTIKDSLFATSMRSPAKTFAKLNQLYSHHIQKIHGDRKRYYSVIDDIMQSLGTIPEHLNESGQASFVVGYYHQNKVLYTPKEQAEPKQEGSLPDLQELQA